MFLTQTRQFSKLKRRGLQTNKQKYETGQLTKWQRNTVSSFQNNQTKTRSNARYLTTKVQNLCQQLCTVSENKWPQILNMYEMSEKMKQCQQYEPIKPGISFYRAMLTSQYLQKNNIKINIPQTMMDTQGSSKILYTDKNGCLKLRILQKNQYYTQIIKAGQQFCKQIQGTLKYKKYCDYRYNDHAPIAIIKQCGHEQDLNFETEVQSIRTYKQKKPKPHRYKYIQRYIYSRNMKAMVFRFCYQRCERGQQKQQCFGYRFQNNIDIFKLNKKNEAYETHKLSSTICHSLSRVNSFSFSKIINKNGITRFIKPSFQMKRFLQQAHHLKIKKLYLDYIIDLFDEPWLINLKYIQTDKNFKFINIIDNMRFIEHTGTCKLCNTIYHKDQLKKMLSTRMIHQFMQHLKKRTKIVDKKSIQFISEVSIHSKQHKTCYVCQCCYNVVMLEIQLMKYEKILANLWNIKLKDEYSNTTTIQRSFQYNSLMQWRLMIYMVQIRNIDIMLGEEYISLHYKLGSQSQESWKFKVTNNHNIQINKLKIHYFFSQNDDIEDFLKQTQINATITHSQFPIANGSTGILSNFKNKYSQQYGQRQTSIILLFLQNGKYCELTIKVGLVCDGFYNTQGISLIRRNNVFFPDSSFLNSNPFPQQWMEIFTNNYQKA